MAVNQDLNYTLDEAVREVLLNLTGLGVQYDPSSDRYHVLAHTLNRALRAVARENEWSYFFEDSDLGLAVAGERTMELTTRQRLRIEGDDGLRLETRDGAPVEWIPVLPRDALYKYAHRRGLWVSPTRTTLFFSRPFTEGEDGLYVRGPIMREPRMFQLPEPGAEIAASIRSQPLDFDNPDLVIAKAMVMYAQTDPIMQPRVPTLEEAYNDIKYPLITRDTNFTDSPYRNEWNLGIQGELGGRSGLLSHGHPHADDRRL